MINIQKNDSIEKVCFKLLTEVFISGGYSNITLGAYLKDTTLDKASITRLFYGVLEKSIQFDYIIKHLCEKSPQKSVVILLKMGLFMLRYTDMPSYAAVDKIVDLAKQVGKGGVAGFINAFLRKSHEVDLPKDDLSIQLSYPKWAINRLLKRYSPDFILSMISKDTSPLKHIRHNGLKISKSDFENKLLSFNAQNQQSYQSEVHNDAQNKKSCLTSQALKPSKSSDKSKNSSILNAAQNMKNSEVLKKTCLGYLVNSNQLNALNFDEYTFQSLSSMLTVKAYLSDKCYNNVLDVCGAPGGKSIYLKELCQNSQIVCNDIHPHRVELIKKYATKMGAVLNYSCKDAAVLNPEWLNMFDLVVCDVPCSGLGVKSKPDILLNKQENDIKLLAKVQYEILSCSASYVVTGGYLCYSTCTIFVEENEDIINKFLNENKNFELCQINTSHIEENNGMVNLYPAKYHSDSFFVARLKRKY